MKHLKIYEQFDLEDFSDEDLFGPNKGGPYDDILIYGDDGPDFKCGDRVICFDCDDRIEVINKIGTIVKHYKKDSPYYLICFDDDVKGHDDRRKCNIPPRHGWYVPCKFLKKLD